MQITFNSRPEALEPGITLLSLLEGKGLIKPGGMAVAVNSAVVPRTQWGQRTLRDGDDILVINAAYGG